MKRGRGFSFTVGGFIMPFSSSSFSSHFILLFNEHPFRKKEKIRREQTKKSLSPPLHSPHTELALSDFTPNEHGCLRLKKIFFPGSPQSHAETHFALSGGRFSASHGFSSPSRSPKCPCHDCLFVPPQSPVYISEKETRIGSGHQEM